jgi:ABC-type branched-subunit amino acid transport system substrate-binding protein
VATSLSALLEERRALLVVSDAGADAIEPARGGGSVFYDSLGYWQASWAMGRWAARNLGRRAVVAASFYESGYDSLYAFQRGLEEAGGEVVETCVTHIPPARHDIGRALAAIREARPDFAYAVYSGQPAVDFVRAYAASGLARRVPLAGSGFLTDETLLPAMGGAALGIRSCLSWGPDLPTPENRDFTAAFQRATGRQPDAFAVLGHETARLIGTALAAGAGDRGGLGSALATATFQAPRGRIAMSPTTHVTLVPLYLRETRRRHDLVGNEVVAELAPPSEARSIAILRAWPKTGWLNAYASA